MDSKCCAMRTKERFENEMRLLMNRLNRTEGQVCGLKGMVERDTYCPDILVQTSTVSAALNFFSCELFSTHIRTCVADGVRQGDYRKLDRSNFGHVAQYRFISVIWRDIEKNPKEL